LIPKTVLTRSLTGMRTVNAGFVVLATLFPIAPAWAQTFEIVAGRKAVPNEVLVKFRPSARMSAESDALRSHDLSQPRALNGMGLVHFRSGSKTAAQLVRELSADPDVEYAEPNYIVEAVSTPASSTPDDPMFPLLWGLRNTGQNGGLPNADIEAVPAWSVTTGARSAVVGIVDTGIDYTHPDLKANVWSAPAAFTVQFAPNDTITCAAGTHGYDAITNTCNPMDQNGHGTHVSGTIGATGNNSVGVTGVNWTASMMGLRFMDSTGKGTVANAIRAMQFAIQLKTMLPNSANIRVFSNSWGGSGNSQALLDEINQASAAGILFVVAAGNDGADMDTAPSYPGAYRTANLVSVAATDNNDALASFSNYGSATVDLGAPGVNVTSTYPLASYASMSGTSMAVPHVSGAAALVLAACASLDTPTLRATLVNNVDAVSSLAGKTVTGGRLNVYKAVTACATGAATPPAPAPAPVTPAFTLSAPAPLALTIGGAASTVTITPSGIGGFTNRIGLSITGLPAGLTASLTPPAVSPGTPSTLKVAALASAVAGNYNFTVKGVSGNLSYSVIATVTVSAPPSFKLTATPASASVQAGSSTTSQITPVLVGNFTGTILLQVSGLPPYSTTTFTQQPGTPAVAMTVATTKRTPLRSFSVIVIGSAPNALGTGTLKQSATVVLSVTN
jgi:subtilisin family serine protease